MAFNYHWRSAPPIERLERDLDALRTTVIQLRHDLTSKANYAAKLEVLLRSRTARMDDLRSKIDQLREQNRRLDAEAERLVQIIRLG
jgi:chromosome segregation ATPase